MLKYNKLSRLSRIFKSILHEGVYRIYFKNRGTNGTMGQKQNVDKNKYIKLKKSPLHKCSMFEIEKKVLSKIYNRPFIGAIIFYTNKFTRKNNFILC